MNPKTASVPRHIVLILSLFSLAVTQASRGDEPAPVRTKEVGIKGHCPVSYFKVNKAVKGSPEYSSEYQGYVYHFAGAEEKKAFDESPEKYAPQFGGLCTTALGGSYGNRMAGDPEVFYVRDGRLFLFSSERARKAFDAKPDEYVVKAANLFEQPALKKHCPVAYQMYGERRLGNPQLHVVYRDVVYRLADPKCVEAFKADPERYVPKYHGLCAEGLSRKKRFTVDPTIFLVVDNRTYLFFDDGAKKTFAANSSELIKAADANWPEVKDQQPTIHP